MPIIENIMQVFQGLISFLTGVFMGDWEKVWQGVSNIFSGIVGGLVEIFKAPFRVIIGTINSVIGGLNNISLPSWVPGIGGKGISIPLIPMFAKGTNKTPDTFIAGEEGPELITGAKGRKVFTAGETGNIFNKLKALGLAKNPDSKGLPDIADGVGTSNGIASYAMKNAKAFSKAGTASKLAAIKGQAVSKQLGVDPPSVKVEAKSDKTYEIHLENKPTIYTNGDPKDIESKLMAMCEDIAELILEKVRATNEDERRVKLA